MKLYSCFNHFLKRNAKSFQCGLIQCLYVYITLLDKENADGLVHISTHFHWYQIANLNLCLPALYNFHIDFPNFKVGNLIFVLSAWLVGTLALYLWNRIDFYVQLCHFYYGLTSKSNKNEIIIILYCNKL